MTARIWPGTPSPLGATYDGAGANFAVFSEAAAGIDLCLFDAADDARETERIALPARTAHVYHGYVAGLKPGQLYGLRARGLWAPADGHRFDESKLLVDPYARAITADVDWRARGAPGAPLRERSAAPPSKAGPRSRGPRSLRSAALTGPLSRRAEADVATLDARDSARSAPKGVLVDPSFDWHGDRPLETPWRDTLIYEVHVKGFTARHPGVPQGLRGTYAGLATDAAIAHLKRLGVTAVELLPIHEKVDDEALVARGLVNYWGYNTLGFFAPEGGYSSSGRAGQQVIEFKRMVQTLHRAGIEVLLDVVYNHTAEGDARGPTLFLRGLDNRAYYRLLPGDRSRYEDVTGCGNTLDARHPAGLRLILDSLRYWVTEMHVDGFRFDLATALCRAPRDFDRFSTFLVAVAQDPVLASTKLIAEPWDVGAGGYQVGDFPAPWSEWNGKYRDAVRRFWNGAPVVGEMGYRLTGSSDLYASGGRSPMSSVNFVVAHDGFTLADLVAYKVKHNEANGEGNRDGSDGNDSDNHGVEGASNDPAVVEARARHVRNLLTTLLVSQGVPMLCGGDEFGRTQRGNNNAYCQDNEVSWHDWELDAPRASLLAFTERLVALRRAEPALRRGTFFTGGRARGQRHDDVTWIRPDGAGLSAEDWAGATTRAIGARLDGDAIGDLDARGEPVVGNTLLLLFNASDAEVPFTLPKEARGCAWEPVVDTRAATAPDSAARAPGSTYPMMAKTVVVLRLARRTTQ